MAVLSWSPAAGMSITRGKALQHLSSVPNPTREGAGVAGLQAVNALWFLKRRCSEAAELLGKVEDDAMGSV